MKLNFSAVIFVFDPSMVNETENELVEDISRQIRFIVINSLQDFVLLHIVQLTCIVHLVDNQLFDIVCIELWM